MFLSRLTLNRTQMAFLWRANPYRVHQRLLMACEGDPRLLFRTEPDEMATQILVQSQLCPTWEKAFADFPVLERQPEMKEFDPSLCQDGIYRFRLLANPTKKTMISKNGEARKTRLGIFKWEDQLKWLGRKLDDAGARMLSGDARPQGMQRSHRTVQRSQDVQTHLAVQFDGILQVIEPARLKSAIISGIGPAKGFGFGLLSLAPWRASQSGG